MLDDTLGSSDASFFLLSYQQALAMQSQLPMNYYTVFHHISQLLPRDCIIVSEGANTMDIGRTMLNNYLPRHRQTSLDVETTETFECTETFKCIDNKYNNYKSRNNFIKSRVYYSFKMFHCTTTVNKYVAKHVLLRSSQEPLLTY